MSILDYFRPAPERVESMEEEDFLPKPGPIVWVADDTPAGSFDRYSGTWCFVRTKLLAELAELQADNEKPHGAEKTAMIRGQIKLCRKLLAMEKNNAQ